jgi:septation ring formation regulator EzrA
MGMEEIIVNLRDDMKELKEAVKHLTEAFISMEKRIISNEKDFETIIREYARTGTQLDELKKYVDIQNQHIWDHIRRMEATCEKTHEVCVKETIPQAKEDVKKDVKIWLYVAILSAGGSVVFSIVLKIIQEVVK